MVRVGDEVEAIVLSVQKEEGKISLGIKQTEHNPWEDVENKYPSRQQRHRRNPQLDQLRRFCRTGARRRRPDPHLRFKLDQKSLPSFGSSEKRRQSRSGHPVCRQREQKNHSRRKTIEHQSLGNDRKDASRRNSCHRDGHKDHSIRSFCSTR